MNTELMRIRRDEYHLTSREVADAAGVALRVEYLAEIGGLVEEEDARKILEALSRLAGKSYSLETVALNIKQKKEVVEHAPIPRVPYVPTRSRRARLSTAW